MAIINKGKEFKGMGPGLKSPDPKPSEPLTKDEIGFILEKLKTADFKGAEFESFYFLWVKLSKMLEEK